jgi:hypothetical protein
MMANGEKCDKTRDEAKKGRNKKKTIEVDF